MSRSLGWVGVAGWAVACAAEEADAELVASGFDGASVSGQGKWVRERLHWPNGENPDEIEHFFVLGDRDPCVEWAETTPSTASTGTATCEDVRASYAARAGRVTPGDLRFEFALWDTREGVEPHIAVEPRAGRYTALDGPDADVLEFTFYGDRVESDWYAAVAATMDCSLPDPWANVPSQQGDHTSFEVASGAIELDDPAGDDLTMTLDTLVVVDDAGGAVGVLDGVAALSACDLVREIVPGTVTE